MLATSVVALLSLAGSASAASFAAEPESLGPIPDGTGGCPGSYGPNRDVTFAVTGVGSPIEDVAVSLTLNPAHTWVGDLSVVLIAPGGSPSQTVFERTGATPASGTEAGDDSDVAGPYTFSDSAPESPSWWEAAAATDSASPIPNVFTYRPSTPGEAFPPSAGANTLFTPVFSAATPNGTWTLRFRDKAGPCDTGSVSAATLSLEPDALSAPEPLGATPPTFGPSNVPSNAFTLGKLSRKTLNVNVSSAGVVGVTDAGAAGRAYASGRRLLKDSSAAGGPGTIKVKLKLTNAATRMLRRKGKFRVNAQITFTPDGGTANSQIHRLKIKRK